MSTEIQKTNNAHIADWNTANNHLINKNYQEALEHFLEAAKKRKEGVTAFMRYSIAFCHEKLGQVDLAFLAYSDAIEILEALPHETIVPAAYELIPQSRRAINNFCIPE